MTWNLYLGPRLRRITLKRLDRASHRHIFVRDTTNIRKLPGHHRILGQCRSRTNSGSKLPQARCRPCALVRTEPLQSCRLLATIAHLGAAVSSAGCPGMLHRVTVLAVGTLWKREVPLCNSSSRINGGAASDARATDSVVGIGIFWYECSGLPTTNQTHSPFSALSSLAK